MDTGMESGPGTGDSNQLTRVRELCGAYIRNEPQSNQIDVELSCISWLNSSIGTPSVHHW